MDDVDAEVTWALVAETARHLAPTATGDLAELCAWVADVTAATDAERERRRIDAIATQRLRAAMEAQGHTTADLATALGLSPSAARHRLNGTTALSFAEAVLAARWLDVPVDVLSPVGALGPATS